MGLQLEEGVRFARRWPLRGKAAAAATGQGRALLTALRAPGSARRCARCGRWEWPEPRTTLCPQTRPALRPALCDLELQPPLRFYLRPPGAAGSSRPGQPSESRPGLAGAVLWARAWGWPGCEAGRRSRMPRLGPGAVPGRSSSLIDSEAALQLLPFLRGLRVVRAMLRALRGPGSRAVSSVFSRGWHGEVPGTRLVSQTLRCRLCPPSPSPQVCQATAAAGRLCPQLGPCLVEGCGFHLLCQPSGGPCGLSHRPGPAFCPRPSWPQPARPRLPLPLCFGLCVPPPPRALLPAALSTCHLPCPPGLLPGAISSGGLSPILRRGLHAPHGGHSHGAGAAPVRASGCPARLSGQPGGQAGGQAVPGGSCLWFLLPGPCGKPQREPGENRLLAWPWGSVPCCAWSSRARAGRGTV